MIINKGLALKSSNILILAALLSVHLSVYEEIQLHILNREFIAFLMGLLEPGDSDFIQKWRIGNDPKLDRVLAGDSLLFLGRLMCNTDSIVHLMSILLHNLCIKEQLAKILASLPVKYGIQPLFKIYQADEKMVTKLIRCLCQDNDF
jgi:hypothetical protein